MKVKGKVLRGVPCAVFSDSNGTEHSLPLSERFYHSLIGKIRLAEEVHVVHDCYMLKGKRVYDNEVSDRRTGSVLSN